LVFSALYFQPSFLETLFLSFTQVSGGYWKRPAADPTEEYSSYRDPSFDISIFESVKILQIRDFNLGLFRNMHAIQQQVLDIECNSNNLATFRVS